MQKKLNSLTSLRFLAAFVVVLYHVNFVLPGVSTKSLFPAGGSIGVSFFFVLSGFILSHAHDLSQPLDLKTYYVKRFARIYPLHFLTLIIWITLFFSGWGNPLQDKLNSLIPNLTLTQSFYVGNLFNLGYNAVSWSLSVEAFFYLVFPLLRRPTIAALAIFTYIAVMTFIPAIPTALNSIGASIFYFNPIARLPEFLLGIITYYMFARHKISRHGTLAEISALALMVIDAYFYSRSPIYIMYAVLGLSFSWTIFIFAAQAGAISRMLCFRFMIVLGEASFSLYLTHHMWFQCLQDMVSDRLTGLPLLMLGMVSAISISVLVYKLVEKPLSIAVLRRLAYVR